MKITVLEPDEKIEAVYKSVSQQDRGKLSVLQRGVWTPISFDVLDYIDCDKVVSHRSTVYDHYDDNYDYSCYYASVTTLCDISDSPREMSVLTSQDDISVKRHATFHQLPDIPIRFDQMDYIDCNKVASHQSMVTDEEPVMIPALDCSYYVSAEDTTMSDDPDGMKVALSDDNIKVKYHSSISQHKNKLSVMQRGEWVPIVFDNLDYITCGKVASHPVIITDGDDIGYNFDVAEQKVYTDKYILHDEYGTRLEELPHWFGEGMYEKFYSNEAFINGDNDALGGHSVSTRRIGLSYALAEETLEADD